MQERAKFKFLWLAGFATLALCAGGCGGVNASGTVSPLMFLLKNESKPATGTPALVFQSPAPTKELAKN